MFTKKSYKGLSKLVTSLSPKSKTSARKAVNSSLGRPAISNEIKEEVIKFLELPDISYCKPGRQDTAYCSKDTLGQKLYKATHYLFWTQTEIVDMFNQEKSFRISYYLLQKIVKEENHILLIQDKKMIAGVKSTRISNCYYKP